MSATAPAVTPAEVGSPSGKGRSSRGKRLTVPTSLAPWYAPSNLRTRGRPVNARASRTACAAASVPEAQKRTRSQHGTARASASASSSAGALTWAKFAPSAAWRRIASVTAGCAWPSSAEPQPIVKSVKARPSVSQTRAPSPRARTTASSRGRLYSPSDPPGNSAHARSGADGIGHGL